MQSYVDDKAKKAEEIQQNELQLCAVSQCAEKRTNPWLHCLCHTCCFPLCPLPRRQDEQVIRVKNSLGYRWLLGKYSTCLKRDGSRFCAFHTCLTDACHNPRLFLSAHCERHRCLEDTCSESRINFEAGFCKVHLAREQAIFV